MFDLGFAKSSCGYCFNFYIFTTFISPFSLSPGMFSWTRKFPSQGHQLRASPFIFCSTLEVISCQSTVVKLSPLFLYFDKALWLSRWHTICFPIIFRLFTAMGELFPVVNAFSRSFSSCLYSLVHLILTSVSGKLITNGHLRHINACTWEMVLDHSFGLY